MHVRQGESERPAHRHRRGPVRIDPASNEVSATIPLGGGKGGDVVVDDSGVWVAVGDEEQGELVRVDVSTNEVEARIPSRTRRSPTKNSDRWCP